jgi:hypothetical protein
MDSVPATTAIPHGKVEVTIVINVAPGYTFGAVKTIVRRPN